MKTRKNDYNSRLKETSEYIQWIIKDFEEEYGLNEAGAHDILLEVKLKSHETFKGFYNKCIIYYDKLEEELNIYVDFLNLIKIILYPKQTPGVLFTEYRI